MKTPKKSAADSDMVPANKNPFTKVKTPKGAPPKKKMPTKKK